MFDLEELKSEYISTFELPERKLLWFERSDWRLEWVPESFTQEEVMQPQGDDWCWATVTRREGGVYRWVSNREEAWVDKEIIWPHCELYYKEQWEYATQTERRLLTKLDKIKNSKTYREFFNLISPPHPPKVLKFVRFVFARAAEMKTDLFDDSLWSSLE